MEPELYSVRAGKSNNTVKEALTKKADLAQKVAKTVANGEGIDRRTLREWQRSCRVRNVFPAHLYFQYS